MSGRENARKKDVRLTNIEAAKAVADVIRTSLGPRGMDKMVSAAGCASRRVYDLRKCTWCTRAASKRQMLLRE